MTGAEFATVARLLLDQAAVVLEPGKEYLVENRLAPVARRHGLDSVAALIARLRAPVGNGLATEVVEAMVTTETSFFRDVHPFETLRRAVIPELVRTRAGERRLNVWCAASSSGQEPYTVALILKEFFPELAGWNVSILATDLSGEMLARSREGKYSQIEVNRGLPAALLLKYFRQDGATWQLVPDVRRMVEFRPLNLARVWPPLPPADLVLLRNVMIYFDVPTKQAVLRRVAKVLRPDGYLVLGGAETTFNLDDSFQRVESLKGGFYRLAPRPEAP